MSDAMDRRTFLGQAAQMAAAGSVLGQLDRRAEAKTPTDQPPATQPALEWRNKQPTMTYAKLGRTNFMASRCVFGAAAYLGGSYDIKLLDIALERGLNYIDTSPSYPNSEAALAPILKKYHDRVWILSKVPHIGWPDMTIKLGEDAKAAKLYTDQLHKSLKTMQVDTLDCFMVQGVEHEWIVTMDSLYDAFVKARKAGKVRYFGLATHTNVKRVCELASTTKRYDVIMLSAHPNNLAELAPAIKKMHEAGIGVVSMKTSGPIRGNPKAYDDKYEQMFEGQALSPFQRAYAYLLFRGQIDAFNAHMPNRRILEENLAVATMKFSQAALDRIEKLAVAEARGACHHCGNCSRACPNGVNVSDMLRCYSCLHHYRDGDMARALYEASYQQRGSSCAACGTCRAACPEAIDLPGVIASLGVEFG